MVRASRRKPPHRRWSLLHSLAFSTLLSSQGADAHLRRTLVRLQGNYSNLPDELPVVNQAPMNFSTQVGVPSAQQTLPDKLPWSCKARQFHSRWGFPPGQARLAAFRPPWGKKNSRDGRGARQID